ncbi:mediator of RNA polymerase II transcription subunit 16-like isoform X2 [Rutidosis leptorrhynchoides]|uniref:mediator of RNA polymerase II transcription subunit 16-like isoform X2 n=1 Tax=Rutidosis leptorrhynchoides TaxID=125765 RepID=UPI003A9913F7
MSASSGPVNNNKDSEEEFSSSGATPVTATPVTDPSDGPIVVTDSGGAGDDTDMVDKGGGTAGDPMDEDNVNPATVFCIRLKQPRSNLLYKMSVPELCRNFSAVAWCGKLNAIACASETCARIPSSNANPPFWIPIHIVIPERPTESTVFNVIADSPRDSVQFIEWSPSSCPRALLIANFHGRITIWTQPSHGSDSLVQDASCWQRAHEWRQDIAVVTKWLSGVSPYRWLSSRSSTSTKSTFEEKFLSQQPQTPAGWPNFLCVCSVFSSGSIQLHWSQWSSNRSVTSKWFCTSKGLLGAGPSGIMAADAIVTDSGALHVAGVPIVNPSTVVVWEVSPGPGNGFQATPKTTTSNGIPPSLNPPVWDGFASLASYLFSWQEYLFLEAKQGKKQTEQDYSDMIALHCSPVSNFSAYVSPEASAQSAATTTWGSGVTAVAFDPTCGGSVIAIVIVEGQYMSPYDPDEGPSITGWRVQRWESSLEPVVLHPIFGNPTSSFGGQPPMQTVWVTKVNKSIPATDHFKTNQTGGITGLASEGLNASDSDTEKAKRVVFDPFDLPSDVRTLARIVYSAHGGEVAVAFLRGGVHIFSGSSFTAVDNYQINVVSAIASPAFSSTSCCSATVWHDTIRDCTMLKIVRVLPPAVSSSQVKTNSSTWERAIAERFWWSLMVGVDWWDAVGCTQSAAEDGIVSLNNVIAVLDADFHSLPSTQHRQQYGPGLDRIKCRLLEGTNAQEVRAMVLDMQARLLLDMLGKGIESALINPSALVVEPWLASGETLNSLDHESMAVDPALVLNVQAYVDAVLDLASHFITRLRRYASFCRTLASHAVTAGTSGNRNMVVSPTQSAGTPGPAQGGQNGTASSTTSTPIQAWVQGAIAKISSTSDGPTTAPSPVTGPSTFMPISINTGTFPGTPAVRLIGDCHFLHRLCQLLLFCFFFRRIHLPRFLGAPQRNPDSAVNKPHPGAVGKVEEISSGPTKVPSSLGRSDELTVSRVSQVGSGAKGSEDGPGNRSRYGSGNAGQGYTFDEVGSSNIQVRLHYIDGNYTVLPEVVEASLGPHMQNMPRPRGADAAGLLLRELELHPPAEEWHRRNTFGGPWSDPDDLGPDDSSRMNTSTDPASFSSADSGDVHHEAQRLWPKRRRMSERDAAFGLNTSVGLGAYLGIMGSRRDVVTAVWKTGLEGVWYKCIRCLRQTSAFNSQQGGNGNTSTQNERETWWISRWVHGCPMCGGTWVRVV